MNRIEGRELLDVIEKIAPLEWARYETRRPVFFLKNGNRWSEDRSLLPPYTTFRFENEVVKITHLMKKTVDEFNGNMRWLMIDLGKNGAGNLKNNWMILPCRVWKKMREIEKYDDTARIFFSVTDPTFGPSAYNDLRGLAQNLKNVFQID